MQMSEILNIQQVLQNINSLPLPIRTAYKLSKISKQIDSEVAFFQEKLNSIIAQYGERDDGGDFKISADGNSILLDVSRKDEWQTQLTELNTLEVDFDAPKFDLDELEGIKLTVEEMNYLFPLINE